MAGSGAGTIRGARRLFGRRMKGGLAAIRRASCPNPWRKNDMRVFTTFLALAALALAQAVSSPPRTPKLGVMVYEDDRDGVVVDEVRPNGPAAVAGLKAGDRIVRVGDVIVKADRDLLKALQGIRPGRTAIVEVLRKGETKSLPVTFESPVLRSGGGSARGEDLVDVAARAALARAVKLLEKRAEIEEVRKALEEIAVARQALSRRRRLSLSSGGGIPDVRKVTGRVQELLQSGASPEDIADAIAAEFPGVNIRVDSRAGTSVEKLPPLTRGSSESVMELDVRCSQCVSDPEPCEGCLRRHAELKSEKKGAKKAPGKTSAPPQKKGAGEKKDTTGQGQ